jgi:hypothetical protein
MWAGPPKRVKLTCFRLVSKGRKTYGPGGVAVFPRAENKSHDVHFFSLFFDSGNYNGLFYKTIHQNRRADLK